MLDVNKDRLDYGVQLTPPEGFVLDAAIATTYSLDLNAMLAVPVALCFNNTLEGDLSGEKIALLEAIVQLKGRLRVFYQKGNIHFPSNYNRIFALLEPCMQAVLPSGGEFSSFHPKLWLLRFVEPNVPKKSQAVRYRLIILSRNLTFDRSWDIALSLDGEIGQTTSLQHQPSWVRCITDLLKQANNFDAGAQVLKELNYITWQPPKPFNKIELRAGGPQYGRPIDTPLRNLNSVLVVSPFIKSQGGGIEGLLQLVSDDSVEKILCSTAKELDAIGADALKDWTCYSINQNIVNGEEAIDNVGDESERNDIKHADLHAKLIVTKTGNKSSWFMGSANATHAALGDQNTFPRNVELMAHLQGHGEQLDPATLLKRWLDIKFFVPHEFNEAIEDSADSLTSAMRLLSHAIISSSWKIKTSLRIDGKHDFTVSHSVDFLKCSGEATISVRPLALPDRILVNEVLVWCDVPLSNISSFLVIEIDIVRGDLKKSSKCVISADLDIEGGDKREQQLLQSLVDSPAKILNYVRLLLDVQPIKDQWMCFERGEAHADDTIAAFFNSDAPLFEQLMIAASRHPEVILRISQLITRLKKSGIEIPADFSSLWNHFHKDVA